MNVTGHGALNFVKIANASNVNITYSREIAAETTTAASGPGDEGRLNGKPSVNGRCGATASQASVNATRQAIQATAGPGARVISRCPKYVPRRKTVSQFSNAM